MMKYDGRLIHFPEWIDTATVLKPLTSGLVSRGYSDQQIENILGGNILRVLDRIFK